MRYRRAERHAGPHANRHARRHAGCALTSTVRLASVQRLLCYAVPIGSTTRQNFAKSGSFYELCYRLPLDSPGMDGTGRQRSGAGGLRGKSKGRGGGSRERAERLGTGESRGRPKARGVADGGRAKRPRGANREGRRCRGQTFASRLKFHWWAEECATITRCT